MQNASQLENAYDTLKESAGSATKEQEAYMDSLEGKINALKESFTAITMQMMDSDFLKGFIDGMTTGINAVSGFIDTFGAIPTTVGVATASLVAFNSKIRENANMMLQAIPGYGKLTTAINGYSDKLKLNIDSIKSQIEILKVQQANSLKAGESTTALGRQMLGLNTNLALTTATMVAMNVVSIALSATLSAIGGMLIGAIISGISKLADSIIVTKDELNDMKQSFSDAFSETSQLDTLIQKQKDLKEELNNTTLSADEQKLKKEELIDVQRQLAELLPNTATGFDKEGNKISEDTDLIQENIDKKKELLAMESVKIAKETNNGEWNKLLNNYDKQVKKVKELQKIYNDTPTPINLENLTKAEEKLDSYKEKLKQLSEMMSAWKDAEFSDKDMSELLFGDIYDDSKYEQGIQAEKFSELKQLVDEYTASIQENTKAKVENGSVSTASDTSEAQSSVNLLKSTYEKLGYTVKEATDRIAELNEMSLESQNAEVVKDATTAYGEAISKTKELDSLLKEINEEQSMTPELIMEIAEKFPEIGSRITDVASVQEFLNNKIQEQTKAQVEAYQIMVQNDQAYYNSKILNNEELNKNFQALCASFVDDQGNAYSIDLKNYTSLAQLKQKLTNDLGEGVADFITNFVTANAQGYNVDLNKLLFLILAII